MQAFQKPPFQADAFQEATFSIPAFQRCAFQYGAFQVDPCIRSDGKSGIWRLELYKLQEESLKKDAEKLRENIDEVLSQVEGINEQEQRQEAPRRARKAKARKPTVVKAERYPEVRFNRKPIYSAPSAVEPEQAAQLHIWSAEVESWLTQYLPLLEKQRQAIISRKIAAANDADYRLRLLLLAA